MRTMPMTILALAIALLSLGSTLLIPAGPAQAKCAGEDRIIIHFPGLGTLILEGEDADRILAEREHVDQEMREIAEMAYAMFSSQEEETAAVWTDVTIHGMNPEPQGMAQTEAPWDPASYVVWCMFVHMENVAKAQHGETYQ